MTTPDATQDGGRRNPPEDLSARDRRPLPAAARSRSSCCSASSPPWIPWGRQAVLFDLPARKFHIFALTLWPQDFYFLTWLLVIAALSLFFFTALAGRLFCGYACPQTVWTETFLWMERSPRAAARSR
jgi:hypothetical protein